MTAPENIRAEWPDGMVLRPKDVRRLRPVEEGDPPIWEAVFSLEAFPRGLFPAGATLTADGDLTGVTLQAIIESEDELPGPEQVAREAEVYALDAAGYDVSIRDAWRDGYAAAEERWNAAANESARLDVLDNNRLRDRVAELERALAEHEQARTLGGPVTGKRVPTPPGAWTNADSAAPVQADYTGSVDETGDQT